MDWIRIREIVLEYLKKYRYVAIVLLIGIILMFLPETNPPNTTTESKTEEFHANTSENLQESLTKILSQIEGAGKVQVLLTTAAGEEIFYQADEDISSDSDSSDIRRETVLFTDANRTENGLVKRIDPPIYQGAIVVCQGADRASIRLSIVEAVANATGLSTNNITVLKMK